MFSPSVFINVSACPFEHSARDEHAASPVSPLLERAASALASSYPDNRRPTCPTSGSNLVAS